MISALIGVVVFLLNVLGFLLLVYCVMSFVMPDSAVMMKARTYVEPVLAPFRELLYKMIPKLQGMAVDFSPILVWLVIRVAIWLLNLLRHLF